MIVLYSGCKTRLIADIKASFISGFLCFLRFIWRRICRIAQKHIYVKNFWFCNDWFAERFLMQSQPLFQIYVVNVCWILLHSLSFAFVFIILWLWVSQMYLENILFWGRAFHFWRDIRHKYRNSHDKSYFPPPHPTEPLKMLSADKYTNTKIQMHKHCNKKAPSKPFLVETIF